ncbi:MAG: hypothetical protein ACE3L7_14645 [Candidatus Pristimantibacillus sp.]
MSSCHYCKQTLEKKNFLQTDTGFKVVEVCGNDDCLIHEVQNLYFKRWFLSKEKIEEKLMGKGVEWKWIGEKIFFYVTSDDYHVIRPWLEDISRENGSFLNDSKIDYVFADSDEI